jgi:PAS domain-containing protein
LQSTAGRLSLTLEASRMGDWSWDAASDRITLSTRAAEILGHPTVDIDSTRRSFANCRIRKIVISRDREFDRCLHERADFDVEYRVNAGGARALDFREGARNVRRARRNPRHVGRAAGHHGTKAGADRVARTAPASSRRLAERRSTSTASVRCSRRNSISRNWRRRSPTSPLKPAAPNLARCSTT